jgi:NAD(P)-dependent dehydrogenase (short-subunit alcohol dehydrogenase family)
MPNTLSSNNPTNRKAYIITGPTSGIGRTTAFELASTALSYLSAGTAKSSMRFRRPSSKRVRAQCRSYATCRISRACDAQPRRSSRSICRS